MTQALHRRSWIKGVAASLTGLWLAACDKINDDPKVQETLLRAEGLNRKVHRALIDRKALAKEFTLADISRDFRANGSISPGDEDYRAHLKEGFAKTGERIIITAGVPIGVPGTTNMVRIAYIGEQSGRKP